MDSINEQATREIIDRVKRYQPRQRWHRLALRLTYPIWKPLFTYIIYELYHRAVLDSSRMHIAMALIDRSQSDHKMW